MGNWMKVLRLCFGASKKVAPKVTQKATQKATGAATAAVKKGKVGKRFDYQLFSSDGKYVASAHSTTVNGGGYEALVRRRTMTTTIPHGDDTRIITSDTFFGQGANHVGTTSNIEYTVRDLEGYVHKEGSAVVKTTGNHPEDCTVEYFDRFGQKIDKSPVANWFTDLGKAAK